MARLIPKMEVDDIALKPERDVARQLVEQLPEDCVVYHSYPWLKAERNDRQGKDTLQEGEADFVIVDPKNGLLVLEVKGGEIEYDSASHCWYRRVGGGRRKQINDPFEQARRNTHYVEQHTRERSFAMREHLPCAYGYAVVFPDCTYSGELPGGSDHAIILSARDLPYIGRRIPEILRKWSRVSNPSPLSKEELNGIVQGLSPCLQLMPVLVRRLEDQEEQLVRLTAEQLRLLDFLAMHERAAIEGVAGSGKTLLARAQAQRFADAGRRTLFVCYNRALAEWLRASMPEAYEDRIVVRHFHGLCSDFCRKLSIPFAVPDQDQDQFWKYKAPDLLTQALDLTTERFDAVVADEGQDFYPDWWLPLEMINQQGDQGPFYIFYDPAQNLFVHDELSIPRVGRPFELPTNCRNTRQIARMCSQIQGIEIKVRDDAPEGVECKMETAATDQSQRQLCQQYIREWIRKEKLSPSQVAILCPRDKRSSPLAKDRFIGDTPITTDLEKWKAGNGVLFATVRSFKGLEADAIIMFDVPEPDTVPYFSRTDFYVGCSRAKHVLVVVSNKRGEHAMAKPARPETSQVVVCWHHGNLARLRKCLDANYCDLYPPGPQCSDWWTKLGLKVGDRVRFSVKGTVVATGIVQSEPYHLAKRRNIAPVDPNWPGAVDIGDMQWGEKVACNSPVRLGSHRL